MKGGGGNKLRDRTRKREGQRETVKECERGEERRGQKDKETVRAVGMRMDDGSGEGAGRRGGGGR